MQTLIVTFQCDIRWKVFANNILNSILFYVKFSQSFFLTSIASCKKYAPSMLYPDKKNLPGIFPEKNLLSSTCFLENLSKTLISPRKSHSPSKAHLKNWKEFEKKPFQRHTNFNFRTFWRNLLFWKILKSWHIFRSTKIYHMKAQSQLRWHCGKIWHLLLWIAWAWDNVFKCMENAATVLSFKKVKIWQSTTIEIIASKCNLSYSYVFILGFIFFSE